MESTIKSLRKNLHKYYKSFVAIAMLIGFFIQKSDNPKTKIIAGIVVLAVALGYTAKSIKNKEFELVFVHFVLVLFGIYMIATSYLEMKGQNDDALVTASPILLIVFLFANYLLVKKTRNKVRIKEVKIKSIILSFIFFIVELYFIYIYYLR